MNSSQKGRWQKGFLISVVLMGLLAGMWGCGAYQHTPYLTDPKIQAGPLEAYVKPIFNDYRKYRLAILPFRVPAQVVDVGFPITEVFHRQIMEKKPFRSAVRVNEYANNLAQAQSLAKEKGADLFLLGQVPYFLDSGCTASSGVQVDLRIVETRTGRTIWYLSDNIMAEPAPIYDLWVTETVPKNSPSVYYLVESLAARMTVAMQSNLETMAMQAQQAAYQAGTPCPDITGSTCPPTTKK